mmetsp:Transcript_26425/g.105754  ORF Transcript_26425/g.105754 Transcript_26425/m.105754 type:complete len:307 (-) Transcript_26425:170-1090(-)
MGANQSSASEVDVKNTLGVLYDDDAKRAFKAAAVKDPVSGEDRVSAAAARAFAKEHGLDNPKVVLFQNLCQFRIARPGIQAIYDEHFNGDVLRIPWSPLNADGSPAALGDEHRQSGLDGNPAGTLDSLYAAAEKAVPVYEAVVSTALEKAGVSAPFSAAPLKGRDRAEQKARNEYCDKTPPETSWLVDIVRGQVECGTEAQIVGLINALVADPDVEIVRLKNRFNPPEFNGYRDVLISIAVSIGQGITHICELQVHHTHIKHSDFMYKSHACYEYFRKYFVGNKSVVEERLNLLLELLVDDATSVD